MLRSTWSARLFPKGRDVALRFSVISGDVDTMTRRTHQQEQPRWMALAISLGLALCVLPAGALAQSADSVRVIPAGADERMHTVKPGDTLWELAEQYLGDGLLWRAIARRNGIAVTSASIVPIKVGQVLVLPPRGSLPDEVATAAAGELAVPQMALAPALRDTSPSAVLHVDQVLAERAKRRLGLVSGEEYALAKDVGESETVFRRERPTVESAERKAGIMAAAASASPRRAEFEAAPFVLAKDDLAAAGHVVRRIGADVEGRLLRTDRVEIDAGRGARYSVGDRLVVVRLTTDHGQFVAVPTGVVEVVSASNGTGPIQAVVRAQSGTIEPGQRLVKSVGEPAARSIAARLVTPDITTTVTWLDRSESLPTLQSYMLLGAGESEGVRAGDEFALYGGGAGRQEQLIATVRVVRTGARTSAALMTRQYAPGVALGVVARRYAKAP